MTCGARVPPTSYFSMFDFLFVRGWGGKKRVMNCEDRKFISHSLKLWQIQNAPRIGYAEFRKRVKHPKKYFRDG